MWRRDGGFGKGDRIERKREENGRRGEIEIWRGEEEEQRNST